VCLFFLLYALKKDPAWLFKNGVFPTNQLELLLKPIYTIFKQPLDSTMLGHSKKKKYTYPTICLGTKQIMFPCDVALESSIKQRSSGIQHQVFIIQQRAT
jgi:hypothetical protein